MTDTPLDHLHQDMLKQDSEDSRRRYFSRFLATQILLALEKPAGETISPKTLEVEGDILALAFDSEARLAGFADTEHYVSMSGRDLAGLLKAGELGLGLNLAGEGYPLHLSPQDVVWLTEQSAQEADQVEDRVTELGPPGDLSDGLLDALDQRLASMKGLATSAFLVRVQRDKSDARLLLLLTGALPAMRGQIAGHIAEALAIRNVQEALDVGFADPGDPLLMAAVRHGLRIDLPQLEASAPKPPGSDPDTPPRLH